MQKLIGEAMIDELIKLWPILLTIGTITVFVVGQLISYSLTKERNKTAHASTMKAVNGIGGKLNGHIKDFNKFQKVMIAKVSRLEGKDEERKNNLRQSQLTR